MKGRSVFMGICWLSWQCRARAGVCAVAGELRGTCVGLRAVARRRTALRRDQGRIGSRVLIPILERFAPKPFFY